jgi:hypothetical protein
MYKGSRQCDYLYFESSPMIRLILHLGPARPTQEKITRSDLGAIFVGQDSGKYSSPISIIIVSPPIQYSSLVLLQPFIWNTHCLPDVSKSIHIHASIPLLIGPILSNQMPRYPDCDPGPTTQRVPPTALLSSKKRSTAPHPSPLNLPTTLTKPCPTFTRRSPRTRRPQRSSMEEVHSRKTHLTARDSSQN